MLPHLVRLTGSPVSANEMIPLRLRHVKWFFNCYFLDLLELTVAEYRIFIFFLAGNLLGRSDSVERKVSSLIVAFSCSVGRLSTSFDCIGEGIGIVGCSSDCIGEGIGIVGCSLIDFEMGNSG